MDDIVPIPSTALTQDPTALRLCFAIAQTGKYHLHVAKQKHSDLFEASAMNCMTRKFTKGVSETPQGAIAILAKKLNIE